MRKLQKTFYFDPVDFGVRKEENGMPEMQEPQNQATDLLLSNGDVQEKLGSCLKSTMIKMSFRTK